MNDVIVIGAGAAGMMAAGTAAKRGKKVLLLEKNKIPGKKLMITGKGRCNFTNASDVKEHIANIPGNGKFITNALYRFDAEKLREFFLKLGLKSKVERGNRVFPVSDKASEVVKALEKYLEKYQVKIVFDEVENLARINGKFIVLGRSGKKYQSEKLIIATGGMSYPGTGSTGDGYRFARKLGHKVNLLKPSLVPVETEENWVKDLDGLMLKNIKIKILNKNEKVQYEDFGELQFRHFGVGGPVILSASSRLRVINDLTLQIDLKPALDEKILDKRLLREIEQNLNKQYQTFLKNLLPQQLIPVFIRLTEIESERPANSIRREERHRILHLLKDMRLKLTGFRPLREAIITSGGICVDEINPGTMESLLESGLYFAGEVIDVDAYTGGFNLQIAFASGFTAGCSI